MKTASGTVTFQVLRTIGQNDPACHFLGSLGARFLESSDRKYFALSQHSQIVSGPGGP